MNRVTREPSSMQNYKCRCKFCKFKVIPFASFCRYAEFLDATPVLGNLLFFHPQKLFPLFDIAACEAQVETFFFLRTPCYSLDSIATGSSSSYCLQRLCIDRGRFKGKWPHLMKRSCWCDVWAFCRMWFWRPTKSGRVWLWKRMYIYE